MASIGVVLRTTVSCSTGMPGGTLYSPGTEGWLYAV